MKSYLEAGLQLFAILAIGIAAVWVSSFFTNEKSQEVKEEIVKEVVKEVILKRPSCPDTTDSFGTLRDSGQVVSLVKGLNSYGENGDFVNKKFVITKSTGSGSQIACGYLYVKAHAKGRQLQLRWEHPYIKPGQFGGHLETDNSIISSTNESHTELLYNLSKILYWTGDGDTEKRSADWAALLNVTDRIQFEIALNTTDKTGVIDEVSIVYQCWSPETGQITHDCKLAVE